jgi:hypothetical protein
MPARHSEAGRDARIGRWGGVEPLYDKYIDWSPYQYSICNPIAFFDVNGKEILFTDDPNDPNKLTTEIQDVQNLLNPSLSSFIGICTNSDGKFVLDVDKLKSAGSDLISKNSDFRNLLELASSSPVFRINYEKDGYYVWENYNNGTDDGLNVKLGTERNGVYVKDGLFLPSGRIDNPNTPKLISATGTNEVYVLNEITTSNQFSNKERVKSLGHELLGHGFLYLKGDPNWDNEYKVNTAEERAGKNFDKHNK